MAAARPETSRASSAQAVASSEVIQAITISVSPQLPHGLAQVIGAIAIDGSLQLLHGLLAYYLLEVTRFITVDVSPQLPHRL